VEAEEKANIFSEKFLDNCKVTFAIEHFDDFWVAKYYLLT
jgi:hypothetical protein